VPLQWQRFDLVVRRVDYFEPPLQRLFGFARGARFRARTAALGGYDVANTVRSSSTPRDDAILAAKCFDR
jgi:putative molybdopterin biosynthesis protein